MTDLTVARIRELFTIDEKDWTLVWKISLNSRSIVGTKAGCLNRKGYRVINIDYKRYRVHNLIWAYMHGYFPQNQIDHISHVRDDNRISNLRLVTGAENNKNMCIPVNNRSGIIGVGWCAHLNKWRSRITVADKCISLGCFENKDHAASARKTAEKKYGFHENHGSKPPLKLGPRPDI